MRKHIRRLFALGISLVFITFVCSLIVTTIDLTFASDSDDQCDYMAPPEFDWEGELDPNEFDKWEVISVQPTPQGLVWMYAKNPDQASPIDIVAMAVDLNSILFGYRYFKYGIPYSYVFDTNEEKYVQHHFTDEQRRSCMKCHQDKLVI